MKPLRTLLLAALPAFLVAACGGGDDTADLNDRLASAEPKVRVVHAAVFSGPVTLSRNGTPEPQASGVAYRGASRYIDVPTGAAEWRVATNVGDFPIGIETLEARRGNRYTFVAVPDFSLTGAELLRIDDPYDWGLAVASARVRVLHAAANTTGALDVYLTSGGTDIANVSPTLAGVAYKTAAPASGSNSLDLAVGGAGYTLTVTLAGNKAPIFQAPITLSHNADWLVTLLPNSIFTGDLRVLAMKSDDGSATQEIADTL